MIGGSDAGISAALRVGEIDASDDGTVVLATLTRISRAAESCATSPDAITAMAEAGIDISAEFPKPWTDEVLLASDAVITMGCGDACPLLPGKRYEDWEIEDPDGKTLDEIRIIRDQIKDKVAELLQSIEAVAAH
jgi:protein-tyrosine-phosphatase